ncbi:FtsL-like putative cell division protein [Marivirga harenae]|uniref:FtsL-like putative cell division protein n=1 Tax=Marivirga harenae TaxID=2010992 RepID=UPI0026E0F410|nr:FtsL-like putative cell division protein [Marivirga harenae]WKV14051.1 FtsL-like putative cell division protein [Marivirga harenae]|tara:strand:+ start:362867 stop:363250 length:384 start_codon:yes stop_codon:yes gene_type:complete
MSENTFKKKDKNQAKDSASGSIFSKLDKKLGGNNGEGGLPVHYLPYVLFLVAIGIFYIGNSHYADKTTRKIDKLHQEVEDLRADYTTLKSEYMFASKQSEVAKKVKKLGLKESEKPPFKIVIEKGEY